MSSWAVFPDADFNPPTERSNDNDADPWSSDTWADLSDFHTATNAKGFERDIFDMALDVFAEDDALQDTATQQDIVPEVQVAIHEQLSSLYSDSDDAESQVIGSIHVKPEEGVKDSFCFVVKDLSGQLEQFQEETHCSDITDTIPYSKTEVGDRVLRVTYPSDSEPKKMTVATYVCSNVVHPIPLVRVCCKVLVAVGSSWCLCLNSLILFPQLVKSKVQVMDDFCRVGLKMRANPTNTVPLANGTILLAVPPDVRGDSIRTSREGGVWDSMKRVVAWPLDDIEPGKLLEIQAQFEFERAAAASERATPKFPILLRCDAKDEQFSDLSITTDVNDNQFRPIKLKVSRSVRILHRKV